MYSSLYCQCLYTNRQYYSHDTQSPFSIKSYETKSVVCDRVFIFQTCFFLYSYRFKATLSDREVSRQISISLSSCFDRCVRNQLANPADMEQHEHPTGVEFLSSIHFRFSFEKISDLKHVRWRFCTQFVCEVCAVLRCW